MADVEDVLVEEVAGCLDVEELPGWLTWDRGDPSYARSSWPSTELCSRRRVVRVVRTSAGESVVWGRPCITSGSTKSSTGGKSILD